MFFPKHCYASCWWAPESEEGECLWVWTGQKQHQFVVRCWRARQENHRLDSVFLPTEGWVSSPIWLGIQQSSLLFWLTWVTKSLSDFKTTASSSDGSSSLSLMMTSGITLAPWVGFDIKGTRCTIFRIARSLINVVGGQQRQRIQALPFDNGGGRWEDPSTRSGSPDACWCC